MVAGPNVADGRWHRVVMFQVRNRDHPSDRRRTIYRAMGVVGSISNCDDLTMGTPALGNPDQYVGRLDDVRLVVSC